MAGTRTETGTGPGSKPDPDPDRNRTGTGTETGPGPGRDRRRPDTARHGHRDAAIRIGTLMTATLVAKDLAAGHGDRTLFAGLDLVVAPGT